MIIIVFSGLVGNVLSLCVFLRVKKRLPKIKDSHCMVTIVLTNTAALIIYTYTHVLNGLIEHLNAQKSDHWINKIDLYTTNALMCKLVSFFANFMRILSSFIILSFVLERLFAVFYPLKTFYKSINKVIVYLMLTIASMLLAADSLIKSFKWTRTRRLTKRYAWSWTTTLAARLYTTNSVWYVS